MTPAATAADTRVHEAITAVGGARKYSEVSSSIGEQ